MLQVRVAALLILLSGMTLQWKFRQDAYVLVYERAEVAAYSPEYFGPAKINNYKFNRTQAASNATFTVKKDIAVDVKLQVQAFKFMSNEYRDFPILFSYSFCECLANDDFGIKGFLKCGNLTAAGCVIKKGTYVICNFFPNGERFPPHVPAGSYKVDVKWFIGPKEVMFVQAYGTVKYIFPLN